MNKNLLYFFSIFILLFSCRSNDSESDIKTEPEVLIKKLDAMFYTGTYQAPGPSSKKYFGFEYDSSNRLTKKKGAFVSSSSAGGIMYYLFIEEFGTIIEYGNKSATIKNFSTRPDLTLPEDIENLIFNNTNQIIEKNIPNRNPRSNKKIKYFYNDKLLIKRETTYPNQFYDPSLPWDYIETIIEDFIYDSNHNLQKIVTTNHKTGNVNSVTKIEEITFSDYDTSKNPFVKLGILNDYFERSLSKNNFRSRTKTGYDRNGTINSKSENNWNFAYDAKGNLILE